MLFYRNSFNKLCSNNVNEPKWRTTVLGIVVLLYGITHQKFIPKWRDAGHAAQNLLLQGNGILDLIWRWMWVSHQDSSDKPPWRSSPMWQREGEMQGSGFTFCLSCSKRGAISMQEGSCRAKSRLTSLSWAGCNVDVFWEGENYFFGVFSPNQKPLPPSSPFKRWKPLDLAAAHKLSQRAWFHCAEMWSLASR